ncbi:MAG: trypsin-like peptidase domain-containing protein, partial [Planctomycetes bacterium]|nr:trypsin-like peptidase domain-containing protein [Planctomycetota bacterium]
MGVGKRRPILGIFVIVVLLLCWGTLRLSTGPTGANPRPTVLTASEIPCGPRVACAAGDLRQVEQRARVTARAVLPAVVAVRNPVRRPFKAGWYDDYASGVIVTEDGIVLSQWHVSHSRRNQDGQDEVIRYGTSPTYLAGEKTSVILHDGREFPAELLGADRNRDLSLLRILEPGPHPFVPLRPENEVQLGDWVLKIGHPMGYRRGRSAPVRLGRVLDRIDEIFSTDCRTSGGDSGGPFFDLDGQLVGIVGGNTLTGMAVTAEDPQLALRAEANSISAAADSRSIHGLFERMLAGEIVPFEMEDYPQLDVRLRNSEQLRAEDWTQGHATRELFRSFVAPARQSVVVVLNHGVAVALGTVVAPDCVITKASELPSAPACRLSDRRVVSARVVGVEPAFDLALLKLPATDLKPIEWSEDLDPPVGTMLAAVGLQELPLAVGVLSVPRYEMANPQVQTDSLPLQVAAFRPGVDGTAREDGVYTVWRACGLAWSAGIRPKDVLKSVDGH